MNDTVLAARIARREMRGGLRGFRILLACIALGVGAIAAVGSVRESVIAGLHRDASLLLGGDVELRLHNQPLAADQAAFVGARARDLETRSPGTAREFPYSLFVAGYAMVYGPILVAMTLYDVAGAP